MWLKWFPWRFVVRRVAKAHGFLDPIALLARLRRFSQPSEVHEPIELLRAGVVLHARGLVNSRAIQHNMDWVWPYWIERQFDPKDNAFIPRAFSITHINLTHRNWTAIGLPNYPEFPIVDPGGLLTPFFDGWSLDAWIMTEGSHFLLPSRSRYSEQRLDIDSGLIVTTETHHGDISLVTHAEVQLESDTPTCLMKLEARAGNKAWAIVALRPYNPEGISFIHKVSLSPDKKAWTINGRSVVQFSAPADRHRVSDYRAGDVYNNLCGSDDEGMVECKVGMATAAALFELEPYKHREIVVSIPLKKNRTITHNPSATWKESLKNHCKLNVTDKGFRFLYDAAVRTLILHSPGDVYPGPYTYKRFWFRDAAFIIHGLLCIGLIDRAERAIDRFPARQSTFGYFHSQDGEWDSNGEALWIIRRFCELTDRSPKREWWNAIRHGGRWISKKRISDDHKSLHSGLLPAGFSAEHLGPNDYYYWDDFWGVAGLEAVAYLFESIGDIKTSKKFYHEADGFSQAINRSLGKVSKRLGRLAMPASPYRRLDAGAIGSLVCGYPLRIYPPDDSRLLDTVNFLLADCLVDGGFFQDIIHSGINAYLTLHVAQVLLRSGDSRYFKLMKSVADLASPTGQWPEAIHPRTHGGCMGDGQHVWAAAEWVLMIRNCFVREEGDRLIICSGIPEYWISGTEALSFGPAPTSFGTLSVFIEQDNNNKKTVSWQGRWHTVPPCIEVRFPGFDPILAGQNQCSVKLNRSSNL